MTAIRGNPRCPTSLHQTRTSTSWVMSDPSSFLSITTLLWITDIWSRSCISSLVLSVSGICDICGDLPPVVDGTVYLLHTRKLDMEIPAPTLEGGGVNDLFVVVTVDVSFPTELGSSGSFVTHRDRSSNSNTESMSRMFSVFDQLFCLCSVLHRRLGFFGQLFLLERTPQQ